MSRKLAIIAAALAAAAPVAASAGTYTVRILAPLPGYTHSSPGALDQQSLGLTDDGRTVGRSQTAPDGRRLQQQGTIWDSQGNKTALATPDGAYRSRGYDINNHGEVVGTIQTGAGFPDSLRAAYWKTPTSFQYLLPDTGFYTEALRINDGGTILGYYLTGPDTPENHVPYIRTPDGTVISITPAVAGHVVDYLYDLTNAGAALGQEINLDTGQSRAVRWTEAGGLQLLPAFGLGDIAGGQNAAGTIAAVSYDPTGGATPYRYNPDGSVTVLGQLASAIASDSSFSINNAGIQAGITYTCANLDLSCALATRWDAAGNPVDLNTVAHSKGGFTLLTAYAINDAGMIYGDARSPSGVRFGYLATPAPEPATVLLLGLGAAGLIAARFRRAAS